MKRSEHRQASEEALRFAERLTLGANMQGYAAQQAELTTALIHAVLAMTADQ